MRANCYSTTAGSLMQTHSFAKFKSSNSFIINKTWLGSTTAGSLMQLTLSPQAKLRKCFIINKTQVDQRPPVR